MGFICKIFGHKWNGCKCERCSETRDEQHDWDGCKCSRCGKLQDEQHSWSGCRCSRCGHMRDVLHNWNGCRCHLCGKVRDEQHNYVLDSSCKYFCEEACTQCGKSKRHNHSSIDKNCSKCPICGRAIGGEVHAWADGKCSRCGVSGEELEDDLNKAWEMSNGTGRTGW